MAGKPNQEQKRKPKNTGKTLKRIFMYLTRKKIHLILVMLFVIISSGAGIAGNYFLKPILNNYIVPFIGSGYRIKELSGFVNMLGLMAGIYLVGAFSTYMYARLMMIITNSTLNTIRKDLFNKMQDLPVKYYDSHPHGELMSRYTSDVDTLRESLSQGVTQLFTSALTLVGTFIMMMIINPLLTLIMLIMLFLMVFIVKYLGKKSSYNFKSQQRAVGVVNGYIEEMVEGQKVVKVFSHEENTKKEFAVLNEELRIAATEAHTYASALMPIMINLSYVNYTISAVLGAFMVIRGIMDIGSIASYLQYSRSFSQPITQISQQFNAVLSALAGAERIFEVIDEKPEEDDGHVVLVNVKENGDKSLTECRERTGLWAWKSVQPDHKVIYQKLNGDVRFENVTFGYEDNKIILKNISLFAKPGQKIAFVGSTGAGKTTITNLINRFYEIQEGTIRYDGINIKEIKKDDLRRSLAVVLQDTHLFTGTVRENIRYGDLEASDEQVIEAAKLANAHYFIKHLPEGYDTILTSDGTNLSQGQRQLLSIARAAIADPPVLILDEATSSIDTRTEVLIEKGMNQLMKGRTVFVIAHRLSTVRNANAIMVLENGEIIERGDHEELLEQKGKYYQLYTGQFELQ